MPRQSQAWPVWIASDLRRSKSSLSKIRQANRDLDRGYQIVRSPRRRSEASGDSCRRSEVKGWAAQVRVGIFIALIQINMVEVRMSLHFNINH